MQVGSWENDDKNIGLRESGPRYICSAIWTVSHLATPAVPSTPGDLVPRTFVWDPASERSLKPSLWDIPA